MSSHILGCIKAPRWFYKEIDKRRRDYFWTSNNSALEGQCKIDWDTVCRPIEEGGLNIKNLEMQNICLLLKFIYKLHTSYDGSWAKWIRSTVYRGNKRLGDKISTCSNSWRYLMTLIQLYRDLTIVKIENGCHTSFWLDSWLKNKPLSIQFLALFSHVQQTNITVAECFSEIGWQLRF
jgi:hypothetical protein